MAISNSYSPTVGRVRTGQGSAIGNREHLDNQLTMLEPEDAPVLSLASKFKVNASRYEWPVDKLLTPNTDGVFENQDVDNYANMFEKRAMLGNYIQKFQQGFGVSDLQEAVSSVGPAGYIQAQALAIRAMKRNIEATICSNNDWSVENGADTPYKMRGLGKWTDPAGASDIPADYRIPTSSVLTSGFGESSFNALLGSIYSVSGEMGDLTLVANVALRRAVSDFARSDAGATRTAYNVNQDATSKKITLSVSIFESDFGTVRVVNGNPVCMPTGTTNFGYLINPKHLGVGSLMPLTVKEGEDKGAGRRGYIKTAVTLQCKAPAAFGKIAF
jgi:hypothetical protein